MFLRVLFLIFLCQTPGAVSSPLVYNTHSHLKNGNVSFELRTGRIEITSTASVWPYPQGVWEVECPNQNFKREITIVGLKTEGVNLTKLSQNISISEHVQNKQRFSAGRYTRLREKEALSFRTVDETLASLEVNLEKDLSSSQPIFAGTLKKDGSEYPAKLSFVKSSKTLRVTKVDVIVNVVPFYSDGSYIIHRTDIAPGGIGVFDLLTDEYMIIAFYQNIFRDTLLETFFYSRSRFFAFPTLALEGQEMGKGMAGIDCKEVSTMPLGMKQGNLFTCTDDRNTFVGSFAYVVGL